MYIQCSKFHKSISFIPCPKSTPQSRDAFLTFYNLCLFSLVIFQICIYQFSCNNLKPIEWHSRPTTADLIYTCQKTSNV